MLKQAIAMAITIPIIIGNMAIADESTSNTTAQSSSDFSASIGLKMWMNEWTYPGFGYDQAPEYHSDAELIVIPVLGVRYKDFAVSASYFQKTDYNFNPSVSTAWNDEQNNIAGFHQTINTERSEFDLNIGYYVLPSLMVSLGYKNIQRDIQLSVFTTESKWEQYDNLSTETSGLTIGIAGVAPISRKIGLYSNFAYGLNMETEWQDGLKYDAKYYLGEFGLLYGHRLDSVPILNGVAVYMGYRFQALVEDNTVLTMTNGQDGTKSADYTQGFVLGVNLAF